MKKKEIQKKLVALGIEFEDDATNKELLALLPEEEPTPEPIVEEPTPEPEPEEDEELSPADKKLSPFLRAYKKQNLRKFKIKWDRGELKNL